MTRRTFAVLLGIIAIVGMALYLRPPTAHTQSAGCVAVQGLNGLLSEATARSTGDYAFLAGDVITISAVMDVGGGPATLQLFVTGPTNASQTGSTVSYTIPQAGTYGVTITNTSFGDAIVTATCGGGSAPAQ